MGTLLLATGEPRPCEAIRRFSKRYPHAYSRIDYLRARRGRGVPDWPEWCFLPVAQATEIIASELCTSVEDLALTRREEYLDPIRLATLGAWRMTQGIFRFTRDTLERAFATPVEGWIDHGGLLTLPRWCAYVETPEQQFAGETLHGFWVWLDVEGGEGAATLYFVIDSERDPDLSIFALPVGPWSLGEGLLYSVQLGLFDWAQRRDQDESIFQSVDRVRRELEPLVSLVLLLVDPLTVIAGLGGEQPTTPALVLTPLGEVNVPARKPKVWQVLVGDAPD